MHLITVNKDAESPEDWLWDWAKPPNSSLSPSENLVWVTKGHMEVLREKLPGVFRAVKCHTCEYQF